MADAEAFGIALDKVGAVKIYGSNIPFRVPARTFVIDGTVAHPVLPFVQALEKEKFQVTSGPGSSPITLRYGSLWKEFLSPGSIPSFMLPEKLQRWEMRINVSIDVELDEHGNHALTITGNGFPTRGNDFLFDVVARAAEGFAQSGHLLHRTDFFQGDPNAVKPKATKK